LTLSIRIPLVRRFRPIVVQPQLRVITIQLEDVRIAIGIGFVRLAIIRHRPRKVAQGCILFVIENQPANCTK